MYIAEFGADKISKVDVSDAIPTRTDVVSSLSRPIGLVIKGNELYISDYLANRILKIDLTQANPTITFVVSNTTRPIGIVFSNNDLYIAEEADDKISKFSSPPLSLDDELSINPMRIYPSPVISSLNIEMPQNLKQATIYNLLGKEVLQTSSKTIDVSNLSQGMYLLKIISLEGAQITKRFIKQ
jgi:DNA-binding beta-propeller fold protein YncE